MESRQSAFLIINHGSSYLVEKRCEQYVTDHVIDVIYHPIGGKLEHGEDPLTGALRELGEEVEFKYEFKLAVMMKLKYHGFAKVIVNEIEWIQHFYFADITDLPIHQAGVKDKDVKIEWITAQQMLDAGAFDFALGSFIDLGLPVVEYNDRTKIFQFYRNGINMDYIYNIDPRKIKFSIRSDVRGKVDDGTVARFLAHSGVNAISAARTYVMITSFGKRYVIVGNPDKVRDIAYVFDCIDAYHIVKWRDGSRGVLMF